MTLHKVQLGETNRTGVYEDFPLLDIEVLKSPLKKAKDKQIASMKVSSADIKWAAKNKQHK